MPVMSREKLRELALAQCREQMNALVDAPMSFTPAADETEWDPILRRHVHRQDIVVGRDFDELAFTISARGEVLAFRDPRRFEGAVFSDLDDATVLDIVRTTGMVGAGGRVEQKYAGRDGMLVALVKEGDGPPGGIELRSTGPDLRGRKRAKNIAEFDAGHDP